MQETKSQSLSPEIIDTIRLALGEDIGTGDVTTDNIVAPGAVLEGRIIAKEAGVIAGLDVASAVFQLLSPGVRFERHVNEGDEVAAGSIASISGPARAILTGERTALNFLGRMSGIATLTRSFVKAVAGTGAVILDTRKTAPGLRILDKLAVRRGGGANHRVGLFDMVLIKDNHIDHAGSLSEAVHRVRQSGTHLEIEVEARNLDDVQQALELRVERILLDNMSPKTMRRAVELNAGRAKLEASGNVTLDNVAEIARMGVDFISIGALTHSARVLDVSLDVRET